MYLWTMTVSLLGVRMPRPSAHLTYTQKEKYEIFRSAFSKLNDYVRLKQYLAAHILAFSILEDRVLSARIQCGELSNKPIDEKANKNKIPFEGSATRLLEWGVINDDLFKSLIKCGDERNEFIHQAMWRLDDFNFTSIVQLRKTINELESSRKKFEKRVGANK
jgi:hypothetical protein